MPLSMSPEVRPFNGYVDTTADALRLIQAARSGLIPRITRRLNEMERRSMIRSGAVFVFSVDESGIKRWTDGYSWTPSRISGNFLVYREVTDRGNRSTYQNASGDPDSPLRPEGQMTLKVHGLIKKTITVKIDGSDHHLISYFTQEDIRSGRLRRPTASPELMALEIPLSLVQSTNFRYPPKLEAGPDGRMTRIRDSEENHELSESPSPTVSTRGMMGDNTEIQYSPGAAFNSRIERQEEAFATSTQILGDLHAPHIMSHPSQASQLAAFCDQTTGDPNLMPTTSHWPGYVQYQASSPTQQAYSPPTRHATSTYPWSSEELNAAASRASMSGSVHPHLNLRLQNGEQTWPPQGHEVPISPLPPAPRGRTSESPSSPTTRTHDAFRTSSGIAPWGWESASPIHPHLQISPSQREARRISSPTDQIQKCNTQQR